MGKKITLIVFTFFLIVGFTIFLSTYWCYVLLYQGAKNEIKNGHIIVYDNNDYLAIMRYSNYKCANRIEDIPFKKLASRIVLIELGFGSYYDHTLIGMGTYAPIHLASVKDKDVYLWSFKQSKFVFLPTDSSFFDSEIIKNVAKDCEAQ